MTKREIASMVLKLAGLLGAIKAIGYIPMLVFSIGPLAKSLGGNSEPNAIFMAIMYLFGSLIYPAFCVLLIIYSDKIAAKLFKEDKTVELFTSMSKDDIMSIAFTCIGLLVIAGAIPELINTVLTSFTMASRSSGRGFSSWRMSYVVRISTTLIKLGLGCWCFLGAKGIVNLRHKIRGHVDSEEYKS